MKLLLDTHVALWAVTANDKLSDRARDLILDPDNSVSVSAISLWEVGIKRALGRPGLDPMPFSAAEALSIFRDAGFELLAVTAMHAVAVESLPKLHGDPFDRLLVAQAISDGCRLLTRDSRIALYSDTVIQV